MQQSLITLVIIYFVFILEPDHGMGTPFDGVSSSLFLLFDALNVSDGLTDLGGTVSNMVL